MPAFAGMTPLVYRFFFAAFFFDILFVAAFLLSTFSGMIGSIR